MLRSLPDGWYCFADGQRWRCRSPGYMCEVQDAGNCPSLLREPGIAERVRRIRSFYEGRLDLGILDQQGTGLDVLVANAMTESYGTVPSPLDIRDLERHLDERPELPLDARLDHLLREIGASRTSRWLVRFESGYTDPLSTPAKVSVGAHHMLVSTAMGLASQRTPATDKGSGTRFQILQLAGRSLHSALLATEYLNSRQPLHHGQVPLIAATYNAGSPRVSAGNPWRLVQYGKHLDRWIAYYNASRQVIAARPPSGGRQETPAPLPTIAPAPAGSPVVHGNEEWLSSHFSLAELVASDTAKKLGLSNQPPPSVVENLRRLAGLLEDIRSLLGDRPLRINSAYRCPELNQAVGSKPTSKHLHGLAADLVCPAYGSPLKISRAVATSPLQFDQVIHEFGRWVHIGLTQPDQALRRQQLTIDRHGTHVGLLPVEG